MFDTQLNTIDNLEQELLTLEAVVAQCRLRQGQIIDRLSASGVVAMDGARNLPEWIAGKLDVGAETARTLVGSVSLTNRHPDLAAETADAGASLDRALVTASLRDRGATATEVETSAGLDIGQARRLSARRRRLNPQRERAIFGDRCLTIQPTLDESMWRLWGHLPGYEGAVVEKALSQMADEMPTLPGGSRPARAQRNADALVAMAQDSLDGPPDRWSGGGPATPIATVFVDATTAGASRGREGCSVAAGPRVGPDTLERILCTGRVEVTALRNGEPLSIGRTSRAISPRLRRAILQRDDGCCVAGCSSRYRLQPHHRVPFSQGGRTDADNLVTLCWFHHHVVVHGYGYRIDSASPPRRLRFLRATGVDPPR